MKILIAGDYCPRSRMQALIDNNDFSFLEEVKPFTAGADYSIVNFECCVADKTDTPIEKIGPNLCCGKESLRAIKQAGFNCVTLANNHFRDYGDSGVNKTIMACEETAIDYVGGGRTLKDAQKVLYKQFDDGVLAVLNVCEKEFTIASNNQGGSAPLDPIHSFYAIQEAKNKADHILVIVHGGIEKYTYPTPRMKEVYRFFIDLGVDVVVNHHQHCISGYEVYNGKPIFYGLGNFCFDWVKDKSWEEGYIVIIEFNKQSFNYQLIPYKQFAEEPKVTFNVSRDAFMEEINCINRIIADDKMLNDKLSVFASCQNKLVLFEPYDSRVTKALFARHLLPSFVSHNKLKHIYHTLRCESHNDVLMAALNSNK